MRSANMKAEMIPAADPSYVPVAGKTYSLFGSDLSTDPYYDQVRRLADELLRIVPGEGMRACMKREIPVVGIPLDANRCMRWMGRFEETSVNLERLSELVN